MATHITLNQLIAHYYDDDLPEDMTNATVTAECLPLVGDLRCARETIQPESTS